MTIEERPPHPFVYTLLIAPFGVVGGYVTVAMVFLATRYGLTVEDGALLITAGVFPHVWKFLWAPIVDTTLTRKRWYWISVLFCTVGIVAMSAIPLSRANFALLEVVIFTTNLATTFLGMAVEGLIAHATPESQRGRVGGWFQAGNLGGTGIGGGAGLWMATHLPSPWMAGAALGLSFLGMASVLRYVPEAVADLRRTTVVGMMADVLVDLWQTVKSRRGLLCAALCVLPIGTGAASGVLAQAEVAEKWGVGEQIVSLVNGALGGGVSALGCLVGGEICARFSSRRVYAAVGVLMAGVAVAMALSPFVPTSYVVFNLLYSFVTGLAYAAFTGFVLDAIGKGAAATKYNVFASLSNTPIAYMGLVLAAVYQRYDSKAMLFAEAAAGLLGIAILAVVATLLRERRVVAQRA
ncbi:MAG: MFS transporter [Phycisphaerales bacterium]